MIVTIIVAVVSFIAGFYRGISFVSDIGKKQEEK